MPFEATWMDLELFILSEKSNREREISYDIAYKKNLKRNDTNEFTKQKQTHRCREGVYGYLDRKAPLSMGFPRQE